MTYSGRSEWSSFGCWSLFCPVQDILMSDLFQRWRAEKPKLMGWYFCGVRRCELGVLRTSPCLPQSPQVLSQAAANWRPHQKLQVRLPFVVPSFLLVPWLPSTLTVKLVHCFIYFFFSISLWCFVTAWYCRCRNWYPSMLRVRKQERFSLFKPGVSLTGFACSTYWQEL